jgi:hypothetical protein
MWIFSYRAYHYTPNAMIGQQCHKMMSFRTGKDEGTQTKYTQQSEAKLKANSI